MVRMSREEIIREPRYRELSRVILSGPENNRAVDRWARNWADSQLNTAEARRLRDGATAESFDDYVSEVRELSHQIAEARKRYNDNPDTDLVDLVVGLYRQRNNVIDAKNFAASTFRRTSTRRRTAPAAPTPAPAPAPKSNTLSTLMPWVAVILGLYWWLGGKSDKNKESDPIQPTPAQIAHQSRISTLNNQIQEKQAYVIMSGQDAKIAANNRERKYQEGREFPDRWDAIDDGTQSMSDTIGNFADAAANLGRLFRNAHDAGHEFKGRKKGR